MHISVWSLALKSTNDFTSAEAIERLIQTYWQASPLGPGSSAKPSKRRNGHSAAGAGPDRGVLGQRIRRPLQRSLCTPVGDKHLAHLNVLPEKTGVNS